MVIRWNKLKRLLNHVKYNARFVKLLLNSKIICIVMNVKQLIVQIVRDIKKKEWLNQVFL